jgi:putative radical SAM enzyme (TIGR03279 family)
MGQRGLQIVQVLPGSIAEEVGLEPGDMVLSINDMPVPDIIEYRYLIADEELYLHIIKQNQEDWVLEIEKDYEDDLGLDFGDNAFGSTKRCHNKCIFCFVDQMPPEMRKTLYIKDDDYRLSFWQGNFITLTNLKPEDMERIVAQKLSPLYVSVHSTDPELRQRILGNPRAGKIMEQLTFLAAGGIEVHAQIVLCPEINDGTYLKNTVKDLAALWPQISSIAVVPVGLTRYCRNSLVRSYTPNEARQVISFISEIQNKFLKQYNNPLVFASDEFYLLAGLPIPVAANYAGFPQIENGIGLTRLFLDKWLELVPSLPTGLQKTRRVTLISGVLASSILAQVVDRLNMIDNLEVCLRVVVNKFFGEQVTVAGLLTASDLEAALARDDLGDLLILPSVMLKAGEQIFLDDISLAKLAGRLKIPIAAVDGPADMIRVILQSPEKLP